MLKQRNYLKGNQILTLKDLKSAPSALWVVYKNRILSECCIDNPVNKDFSYWEDDEIQRWLDNALKEVDLYERVLDVREIIFSDKVDNMLDDMLSSFAYEYSDSEYHQEEIMEKFLRELKERFKIEVREDD